MSALKNNDGGVGGGLSTGIIRQHALDRPTGGVIDMELTATETPGGPVGNQAGPSVKATGDKEVSILSSEDLLRPSLGFDTGAETSLNVSSRNTMTVKLNDENDDFDSTFDDVESIKTNNESILSNLSIN